MLDFPAIYNRSNILWLKQTIGDKEKTDLKVEAFQNMNNESLVVMCTPEESL